MTNLSIPTASACSSSTDLAQARRTTSATSTAVPLRAGLGRGSTPRRAALTLLCLTVFAVLADGAGTSSAAKVKAAAEKRQGLLHALEKHIERAHKKKKATPKDALVKALVANEAGAALAARLEHKSVGASKKLIGGWLPLHVASHAGSAASAGALLGAEADGGAAIANKADALGLLPLHLAQLAGHTAVVDLIKGAMSKKDLAAALERSTKLLREVVLGGYADNVRNLVEAGAQIDAASSNGWTALHLAAYQGDVELTRFLLGRGAKLDAKDEKGLTPIELAQLGGFKPVVTMMADAAKSQGVQTDAGAIEKLFLESVKLSIKQKDPRSMANLIGGGVDINARQAETKWTALHICAKSGDDTIELMKTLVANGADANLVDAKGYTALEVAQLDGHGKAVAYLKTITKAKQDTGVQTAMLMEAIRKAIRPQKAGGLPDQQRKWLAKVKNLVKTGADVNARANDEKRWTPLHWATLANHVELVKFLLESKADPNAEDKDKFTPLTLAQLSGHYELADVLRPLTKANAPLINKLFLEAFKFAIKEGHETKFRNLVEVGHADVSAASDQRGFTALHMAAHANKLDLVKYLLEKGAAVDAQDQKKFTPLMFAASGGHIKIVRLLIDAGADAEKEDAAGLTAREMADKAEQDEVLEYLDEVKSELDALKAEEAELAELEAEAEADEMEAAAHDEM